MDAGAALTDEARELLRGTHRNRILCHDPLPRDGFIDVCNLLMERGGGMCWRLAFPMRDEVVEAFAVTRDGAWRYATARDLVRYTALLKLEGGA